MIRFQDGLYGAVELPDWLHPIILAPEVQRLRSVRLINTSSPYVAALSDVRRFTHVIGVLALATRLQPVITRAAGNRSFEAFLVAAAVHDIGTPPFGHLFEYLLAAELGWDHEQMVEGVINGTYRPERLYHQIYFGRQLKIGDVLRRRGLASDDVTRIVRGVGPIGRLLSGTLDIDNIDNVSRMGFHLGFAPGALAERLADALRVDGDRLSVESQTLVEIQRWSEMRRRCYETLLLDARLLSGQAMLTDALARAFSAELIGEEHWWFTDEQLLMHLAIHASTADVVERFANGDYYDLIFLGHYCGIPSGEDLRKPAARAGLAQHLSDVTGVPCTAHVFYDRGTFAKSIDLRIIGDSASSRDADLSQESVSTIIGVFTPRRGTTATGRNVQAVEEVLAVYGFTEGVSGWPAGSSSSEFARAPQLPF